MRMSRFTRFLPAAAAAGFVATAALLHQPAAGDELIDEGVPAGMVAFFNGETACPEGWVRSTEAQGRLILPTTTSAEVGVAVGMPLGPEEDRQHQHNYAAQIALPYKSIAAADGGNKSGAKSGGATWADKTAPAASGLPFIQLLTCERP